EGFFAYQDEQGRKDMLLLLDSGMFYEFVKADEFFDESPPRITIEDVELNVNYVLIVSSNAGLWAYNVGDTIMFTCKDPYRVIVTGRIKHFISAFGEHVIGKEVDMAMQEACNQYNAQISEFTVAPQINPESGLPYHEWFVEFEKEPKDINEFSRFMDKALQEQNKYYYDLIAGKILRPLKITKVKKNGFKEYMEAIGKLDAQNKVPRLTNDRKIASHFEGKQLTY
ncbi:MAG: GH3 auxin-responsive promoter family protein, partial [Flavobacteriaceae bacterium]|nr:GH3 auxin-responsive promoter family protein [Flavobacteriaceae bacterium]